ncbi:LIP-domain-containing protein [Trichoderma longibrachiatum ATCC 18648]|uniref:LIP-domain-containing protein n=1 Tax=Trichoderma longibrachiatum ATCC 18648 TaxID=983965 RepID=A0A2T4C4K5_TRILO|nr:LIP-domain-containing protein [Trichoderma longibrachiatum ATCC 18648]
MRYLSSLLAASLVSATRFTHIHRSEASLPPSQDPFYAVPENITAFSPGEIINYREPPSQISAFGWTPTHIHKAYQILYRTTDSQQNATAGVLTALIPPDADYDKLLSLQMAEDSATIDCGPSYTMQLSSQSNPLLASNTTALQLLFAEAALAQKWIVIVPDHEGPKGSFTASKVTAHTVLDGIRAATQSNHITGIEPDAKIGLWGYSGGAAATQIAITMQGAYAPELDIAGVAMGGLSSLAEASDIFDINEGPSAGLIPSAMLGLATEHPDLQRAIDEALEPQFRDLFYSPLHQCLEATTLLFFHRDVLGMFRHDSIPGLKKELVKAWKRENDFPPSKIKAPLYIYQSVIDHLSDINRIDAEVRDYCDQGVSVHYERANSTNLSHVKYGIVGVYKAISWMQDRLDGKGASRKCVTLTDTTSTLDPNLAALFPKIISDALNAMVNGPL